MTFLIEVKAFGEEPQLFEVEHHRLDVKTAVLKILWGLSHRIRDIDYATVKRISK